MSSYFEARRINPEQEYKDYILPIWLKNQLPKDREAKILDIGCGYGKTLRKLEEAGYTQLFGIDINKKSIEYCRKVGLNVLHIQDLLKWLNSNKEQFDFIIMQHVIEHLKKDEIIPILIAINNKTLSMGGCGILICTPNAQSLTSGYWHYEDFTHNLIFTTGSLYYILYMAGFKNIEFLDKYAEPYIPSKMLKIKKYIRMFALKAYDFYIQKKNVLFANTFHNKTPRIYTSELKVIAKK